MHAARALARWTAFVCLVAAFASGGCASTRPTPRIDVWFPLPRERVVTLPRPASPTIGVQTPVPMDTPLARFVADYGVFRLDDFVDGEGVRLLARVEQFVLRRRGELRALREGCATIDRDDDTEALLCDWRLWDAYHAALYDLRDLVEASLLWILVVHVAPFKEAPPPTPSLALAGRIAVPFDVEGLRSLKRAFSRDCDTLPFAMIEERASIVAAVVAERWVDVEGRALLQLVRPRRRDG